MKKIADKTQSQPMTDDLHDEAESTTKTVIQAHEYDRSNLEGPKNLDPHEDEALLYFLKHKRHLSGLNRKQCKRVNRIHHLYTLEKDTSNSSRLIFHPSGKVGERNLIVPSITDNIIERAHLLGHFQTDSVTERIRAKYYWPKMRIDAEKFIKQCLVCKRHQRTPSCCHPDNGIF